MSPADGHEVWVAGCKHVCVWDKAARYAIFQSEYGGEGSRCCRCEPKVHDITLGENLCRPHANTLSE